MAHDVRFYEKENGEIPLADYLAKLRDRNGKLQIHRRIQRAALGNLGDKSEQTANINTARGYLADFQRRNA